MRLPARQAEPKNQIRGSNMSSSRTFLGGLVLMALAGGAWAQTPPPLLAPPPASVCTSPTAPTEPGNVHMFPGRWWNPQRNGIGWDFFYGEGQQSMYLTWFTFDPTGRPVWLHGENKELVFNAVTGERTWQSNLYVASWTFSYQGRTFTPVGSVSVTFPNQTTTRAAVRWRWDVNSSIPRVSESTYDECLYDTFREQRELRGLEGVINEAFSSNWFYQGLVNDPLVGWGVDLLIDVDPVTSEYIETAAAAIFDTSGRPVWLQSEDPWGTNPPPDDTLTLLGTGALRYLRYTPVPNPLGGVFHPAVTDCATATTACGLDGDHDGTPGEETYGHFARRLDSAANGRMRLTAQVGTGVTGGAAVDWPPPSNTPALPQEVPVMRFDSNHVMVDKSVCRVPGPSHTCTFQISWSTNDPAATVRRFDLNNGGLSSVQIASGLSSVIPDTLPVGARVQYEITYRYNGTGVSTKLRTPEVRVLLDGVIADANVQNIACTPQGNNGCDLTPHDPDTGAIAGEASTDGGAAMYSIPITLPPGRNGVQPELALSYSSRSGSGIAGLGWSLSGLSSIHRCPKTAAQDGVSTAVTLSNNDALCLDGERLVRTDVNGVATPGARYGVSGAYYRTEINNFARVTQFGGDLTSDASCFKVQHKSGEVSYYGGVSDSGACSGGGSRQGPDGVGGVPLSWQIERSQDASGNSISYTYQIYGKGEKLPFYIRYTGKEGVEGDRQVLFTYEDRPLADRSRSFIAGGQTERTQRLQRITTSVASTSVNSYTLTYTDPISGQEGNLHSGRSALQSIKQCASGGEDNGGAEVCLPETVVSWNDMPPDHVLRPLTVTSLPAPAALPNGAFVDRTVQPVGDLDGDGVREVLVRQNQSDQIMHTWLVKQNADRAVQGALDITSIAGSMLYYTEGMQADFDGDGRSDLLAADEGAYLKLYRWNLARAGNFGATPAATFTSVTLNGVAPGHQLVSTDDLDGDGYADLLLRRRGSSCSSLAIEEENLEPGAPLSFGQILCYYRNTTTSPASVTFAGGVQVYGWTHPTFEGGLSAVGDLNGDSRTDLAINTETPQTGGPVNAITTVLLSGMPGLSLPGGCIATTTAAQWYACTPGALNLPATDTGYRTTGAAMRWHDVNGDGLSDVLYALRGTCSNQGHSCGRGSWHVQIANGRGFNASVGITGNTDALLMTTGMEENRLRYAGELPSADVDSDGKPDLLYPVSLAARQCNAVNMSYQMPSGDDACGNYDWSGTGGEAALEVCEYKTVWMCANDPAADIAGTTSPYQLPDLGDMPTLPFAAAITTDNLYSVRTHKAIFSASDLSLYNMAGLRFVATAAGYEAQSFSLDASAGTDRAAHRVALTLGGAVSITGADDIYGDGLADLITRAGCYNQGINAAYCHYVGDGTTGPEKYATGPTPNAAPVMANVVDLNNGLRSFVNENVGIAEETNSAPWLPGLVRTVTNGFNDQTDWTYFPLSSKGKRTQGELPLYALPSNGYADSNHFYFQSTMPVVGSMTSSNGTNGMLGFRSWRYGYSEAMYNRLGRGFQGFRGIFREQVPLSGDLPRAIRELTLFHQKFPLTGRIEFARSGVPLPPLLLAEEIIDRVRPITDVSYEWGCHRTAPTTCTTSGAPSVTSFDYPFLNKQVTTSYDPGQAESGTQQKVAEVTVRNYNPSSPAIAGWDAYGNLLITQTEARDFAETSGSIAFVTSKTTQRAATYTNTTNTLLWWPGQLTATDDTILPVQYTAGHPLPADVALPTQTLHTDYTWNLAGRTPATVTVENADPTLRTQKVITYPAGASNHGMPSAVSDTFYDSVIGSTVTRTTQTIYGADGYFPAQTIDASGLETDFLHRARDGQVREMTLPTDVRARSFYDAFGRAIRTETYKVSGGNETLLAQPVHTAWNSCTGGMCMGVGGGGLNGNGQPAEQHAAYRVTTVQNGSPTMVTWFDLLGREIKSAVRGFDGTFIASLSEYDAMGTLAKKSVPFFLSSGSATSPFYSTFTYDRAGRMTRKTSPDGENDVGQSSSGTGYSISDYTYAGNRTTVQLSNSRGLCVPSNLCLSVKRYSGVAGLMRTDDALNGMTRYWADAAGRPAAIADANTNAQYPGQIVAGRATRATYNKVGQRTNATDPNQGSWNFIYNGAGELVQQTDARNIVTTIRHDAAGRPTLQTSTLPIALEQPIEHYRDEWSYQPATGLVSEMRRCVASSSPASCTTATATWAESYVYDYGRLASASTAQRVANNSVLNHATIFHYDANHGREKAVEYASGLKVQRIFTKFGALRDVLDADTGERFWGVGAADTFGNVTRQDYGNGVVGEYTYDPISGHPVARQWSRPVNGVPQVFDRIEYRYDVLANLAAQRRVSGNVVNATEDYTFDKLQRLKNSTVTGSGYSVGYDYDPLGNLTRKSDYSRDITNAYQYAAANGCGPNVATTILMPTGAGFDRAVNHCDSNGNVIKTAPTDTAGDPQGSPREISYDASNRPRYIRDPAAPSSPSALFTYAPDGRRVYEVLSERYFPNPGDIGQTRLRHIVQGQRGYQVELASDASGWANATYRHEIGDVSVVLRDVDGQATTRDVAYKTTDRLGSPLGILDKTGQFRQRAESGVMSNANTQLNFSPFGAAREPTFQPRAATGEMPGRLNLTPSTRLGFTGHEHLDSLGLIHMNGRVYDHRLGRFLSVDPFIQFPANSQSLNPYSYIMNNPMAGTDPTGYTVRDKRRFLVGGESCMGDADCERDQTMSGPVKNFRRSFSSGGAPSGTWNGWEAKQQIRKAQNNARATVEIGELVDLGNGIEPLAVDGVHRAVGPSYRDMMQFGSAQLPMGSLSEGALSSVFELYTAGKGFLTGDGYNPYTQEYMTRDQRTSAVAQNIVFALIGLAGRGNSLMATAAELKALCFVEGTPVHTARGPVPIEQIREGDIVAAKDEVNGEIVWKPVVRLFRNADQEIVRVSLMRDGGTPEDIGASLEHPFWIEGHGWTAASDLQPGDRLVRLHGGEATVASVAHQVEREDTYNFEVADVNTYFVGLGGVWVHNQSVWGTGAESILSRALTVEEAGANLAQQIGKNRVSIMTPSGRMQIDLAGKSHFEKSLRQEIPTPHVKFQELNVAPNGRTNLGPGTTRPATMDDIRLARKVIERRGN
jgi:RHS repeat-associated protein